MGRTDYRVGIIGCGGIAHSHAEGVKCLANAQLVACAEIIPQRLEEFQKKFEVPHAFSDYREMLDKVEVDIVIVATRAQHHAEPTVEAASRKVKGILCEKPMAKCMGEVDTMLQACEENGVKLAIAHQSRIMPSWQAARRLLSEGCIGEPQLFYVRGYDGLLNTCSHLIDAALFLSGDQRVEWVIGQVERKTDRYERGLPIEDSAIGIFGLEGGARGVVESDIERTISMTVCGTEGIMFPKNDSVRVIAKDVTTEYQPKLPEGSVTDWFALLLLGLIDWIEGKGEHASSARFTRQTMEVMMGIYESARFKGRVVLPVQTKENPIELMIADGTLKVEKIGKYDIRG